MTEKNETQANAGNTGDDLEKKDLDAAKAKTPAEVIPAETTALTITKSALLEKKLSDDEEQALVKKSTALVDKLVGDLSNRQLMRSFGRVGEKAQEEASEAISFSQTRMSKLTGDDRGKKIRDDMTELTLVYNKINPVALSIPSGFWGKLANRLFGWTPSTDRVLAKAFTNAKTVKGQVAYMKESLNAGGDMMEKDIAELDKMYTNVQERQIEVEKNKFLCNLLAKEVEHRVQVGGIDDMEARQLQKVQAAVLNRIRSLEVMDQVFSQFFISIDVVSDGDESLRQSIFELSTVAGNTVDIALNLKAALANQEDIIATIRSTQAFTEGVLVETSKMINEQTDEVIDIKTRSLLAISALEESNKYLMETIQKVQDADAAVIAKAKEEIPKLQEMTANLKPEIKALRDGRGGAAALPEAETDEPAGLIEA